jgi:hypothetical protein
MQEGWFGQVRPSGWMLPAWAKPIVMTATATIYTQFGFAIAADGWQRWENLQTRDDAIRQGESDSVQKIYGLNRDGDALSYLVRGHVANKDRSFDLGRELEKLSSVWRKSTERNPFTFVQWASTKLEEYVEAAKAEGRVEEYPGTFIDFTGYASAQPFWIELQFLPFHNPHTRRLYEISPRSIWPGCCIVSGSLIIRDLIFQDHPSFSTFCKPFDYTRSLDGAVGFVKGYIQACCSSAALEFDPTCDQLGGHIHVATITREQGFQWAHGLEPIRP